MPETNGAALILLVGSNPLPNYLSACALRPQQIVLVYTSETTDAKDRLRRALSITLGDNADVGEAYVDDATCATAVGRVMGQILRKSAKDEVLLNYTGGTKVMAAHARMAFHEKGGLPEHASYLDEGTVSRGPRLRFDNGTSKALDDYRPNVPLDLKTILGLHGITYKPRSVKTPAPTVDDANTILRAVIVTDPELTSGLYDERKRLKALKTPASAAKAPFRPADYGLALSLEQLPNEPTMVRDAFENWYKFIGGEWLEEWLGAQIRALNLNPSPEIVVGVNVQQRGDQKASLEVDVAAVRGHRSHFISCTTDKTKDICKSKLFEIAVRSRQLGGELARAAIVCLANDKIVEELQADINDVWGASNTTRVFGLSALKIWSGFGAEHPDLTSLKSWLES